MRSNNNNKDIKEKKNKKNNTEKNKRITGIITIARRKDLSFWPGLNVGIGEQLVNGGPRPRLELFDQVTATCITSRGWRSAFFISSLLMRSFNSGLPKKPEQLYAELAMPENETSRTMEWDPQLLDLQMGALEGQPA